MRVAINVEQLLYRSPGGIGRYTAQLATLLASLEPVDEVLPFVARHPRKEVADALRRAGAPDLAAVTSVSPLPRPLLYEGWMGPGWPPLTWGDSRLRQAELVHAPSVAIPPRGSIPLVVTVHDAGSVLYPETYPPNGRRFHRRGLRATARRADLVIAVSQSAAEEISAHTDIDAGRIRVVPQGVAPPPLDPAARDEVLIRHGLDDAPFVLWVGSLEPRKGVGTVVAAMAELRRRGRRPEGRARLVLVGFRGWLSDGLIAREDRAALGDDLRPLGQVSDPELWALYAGATIFAFPSRHEGFGYPVVEAMSQGTAVVCSDLPVLREVAGNAARRVAVDEVSSWADALGELLADSGLRDALGEAGRRRAARYSAEGTVAATRAVYREVLGR
ncbi:MAG: glycosyltransferase family 4 protein [Acidimicrobiales bacterium]